MDRSTRIAVNTVASYARIAVAAGAGFVTLPLALRSLGATDFGIFSVIAGSLTALLFINGALTNGALRHMAYSLGEGSTAEAGQWFSASLVIHGLLAIGVLGGALLLSHWVIYSFLNFPQARLGAAMWTYRVVAVLLFMCIISTPYQALLMAKESFVSLYLMAIAGSLFLFIGVVSLKALPGDRLIWYAGINAVSDAFLMLGPVLYCLVRHAESRRLSFPTGGTKIRRLLSFSGWSLLGTLAVQIRYQGPALLFNRFVGTTANVANGMAMQVNGFGSSVSNGLLIATSPTIVKAEASGDRSEMLFLSNLCNKYGFVLLWLFIGPVLFEMTYCLRLWLREVPADTVIFSTILLIVLLIDMLTAGFRTSVQAEGRIALYQAVIGALLCISVPVAYVLLRFHMPASSVLWAMAGGGALAGAGRIWFVCQRIGLKAVDWVNVVLRPCLVITIASCLAMAAVQISMKPSFLRAASLFLLNSGIVIILTCAFASSPEERTLGQKYISRLQEALFGNRRAPELAMERQQPFCEEAIPLGRRSNLHSGETLMQMKMVRYPFPHVIVTDVIPWDLYRQLKFPELQKRNNTRAGWDLFKGEKRYNEFFAGNPIWKQAKDILDSEKLIFSICRAFEDDLKLQAIDVDRLQLIDFVETPAQQQMSHIALSRFDHKIFSRFDLQASDGTTLRTPHVDHARRIFGGVFFLCDGEEEGMVGGDFGLWRDRQYRGDRRPHDCELVVTYPVQHNTLYIFLNRNDSFHGPKPLTHVSGTRKWAYFSISARQDVWAPDPGSISSLQHARSLLEDGARFCQYHLSNLKVG